MWPFSRRANKVDDTPQVAPVSAPRPESSTMPLMPPPTLLPFVTALSQGLEALIAATYTHLDPAQARTDLDKIIQELPYQTPPELYTQLLTEPYPTLQPLYIRLSGQPKTEAIASFHYLYQHFINLLSQFRDQPSIEKLLEEVYTRLKPSVPPESLITLLDVVPSGFLDAERGSAMGRDELMRVLEELRSEKDKVEAAQARDEALLTSIGDGVVAIDPQYHVIFINKSALEMLGLKEELLKDKSWFEVVKLVSDKEEEVPLEQRPMYQALTTGKRMENNSLSFRKPDGSLLPAAITATPFLIHDQPMGAILTFKDITKERELDKEKTEFISVASHQLRTPLGSIKWNLEMLNKGYYGELVGEVKKTVAETNEINERLIRLVNALLNVSRIEQGRVQDHPVQTNIRTLIDAILKELEPLAQAKQVQVLLYQDNPQLPILCIDMVRLREVVENIISNAIKYNAVGGKVEIALKLDAEFITIEVHDEGMGIPESDQHRVFSRFFRAENAVKQEPNGTGFGLFVVKSYMEGWGGKVSFKSPRLPDGKGTSFYLQLPVSLTATDACELPPTGSMADVQPSPEPQPPAAPAT